MKKLVLAALAFCLSYSPLYARDTISVVGSSTVYPLVSSVAERLNQKSHLLTVVESTGTGGGIKLFCGGVGFDKPDAVNASRQIKESEIEACKKAGVNNPIELKIGRDAIVFAHVKDKPTINLTLEQIYLALAKDVPIDGKLVPNPYKKWSDIDPSLPDVKIEVFGPPPTSGTRDSFVALAVHPGCKEALKNANIKLEGDAEKAACETMREDGGFIESGENDSLLIQKLSNNPDSFAIFGFSFLDNSRDKVAATSINGVEPTIETATDGTYIMSRDLYVYIKREHIGKVPGLKEFAKEVVSEEAIGDEGYLVDKGLIVIPLDEREAQRAKLN